MEKESYQPSEEEMGRTEEMMTEEQRERSEERRATLEAGLQAGKEEAKENILGKDKETRYNEIKEMIGKKIGIDGPVRISCTGFDNNYFDVFISGITKDFLVVGEGNPYKPNNSDGKKYNIPIDQIEAIHYQWGERNREKALWSSRERYGGNARFGYRNEYEEPKESE